MLIKKDYRDYLYQLMTLKSGLMLVVVFAYFTYWYEEIFSTNIFSPWEAVKC